MAVNVSSTCDIMVSSKDEQKYSEFSSRMNTERHLMTPGVFFVAQCREMGYYESRFLGREEKKDEIFL